MPIPKHDRVIYQKNPLVEVICQLRFPAILRIDAELPAAFQDQIRTTYPVFVHQQVSEVKGLPPALASALAAERKSAYEFLSASKNWKVSLTRDFLALSTTNYERWEEFRERLTAVLAALRGVYAPAFFSRVGLRYRDVIDRRELGLDGRPWSDLLRPEIAAEFASPDLSNDVIESVHQLVLKLEDFAGNVRLQHGLATNEKTGDDVYVIDADFFTERQTGCDDVFQVLDTFNRVAGNLFQSCISGVLHDAMGHESAQA